MIFVVAGAAGLGLGALFARNIYKCSSCAHLTARCRFPRCTGMALTGEYWDDEFCGQCRRGNDRSQEFQRHEDQKTLHKVREIMKAMQKEIELAKAKIAELEKDRATHKEVIRRLNALIRRRENELTEMRHRLTA